MDDKRIADAVEELNAATARWLEYVRALNQCASTDRMLEGILEKADTLKKVYEEELDNVS